MKAEKFVEPQPEAEREAEKPEKVERAEKRPPKSQVPCRYWQNGSLAVESCVDVDNCVELRLLQQSRKLPFLSRRASK